MANKKYSMETYIHYEESLGIYDYLKSYKFVNQLKALEFKNSSPLSSRELDEISLQFYNTEELWWVIAVYNDIIDVLNISSETVVYLPARTDLEKLFLEYQEK